MKVLVIIPAYNEEENIKKVVESVYDLGLNLDVVVINDGSTDDTLIEASETKAVVINLPNNLGIGRSSSNRILICIKK